MARGSTERKTAAAGGPSEGVFGCASEQLLVHAERVRVWEEGKENIFAFTDKLGWMVKAFISSLKKRFIHFLDIFLCKPACRVFVSVFLLRSFTEGCAFLLPGSAAQAHVVAGGGSEPAQEADRGQPAQSQETSGRTGRVGQQHRRPAPPWRPPAQKQPGNQAAFCIHFITKVPPLGSVFFLEPVGWLRAGE